MRKSRLIPYEFTTYRRATGRSRGDTPRVGPVARQVECLGLTRCRSVRLCVEIPTARDTWRYCPDQNTDWVVGWPGRWVTGRDSSWPCRIRAQ